MVNLVTVKDRELMKVGSWHIHSGGEFNVTPELIKAAISAHESGVLRKPTIRLGHNDPRFTGDPAVGWVDNIHASEDGATLYGDLVGVPQWLADTMPAAYPSLSIEGMYDYTAPDGSTHDFILTGLALLGATPPGIAALKSVQDVEALYGGEQAEIAAAVGEIGGTPVQLMAADDQKPYGNVKYADPKNGKYPIDTKEHVKAAWSYINMPKNQKGYSPAELAQIKGRIKTAAKKFGIQIEAAAASGEQKGAIVASFKEKLAEKLGLEPDADEDAILEAFEKSEEPPAASPAEVKTEEPAPEPVAAGAPAPQAVQLQKDQYDVLMAAAAEVHKIREEQATENREKLVMAAVADGRITPASKPDWIKALEFDPGGHNRTALASLAPGFVPVKPIGHSNPGMETSESSDADDAVKQRVEAAIFQRLGISRQKAGSN